LRNGKKRKEREVKIKKEREGKKSTPTDPSGTHTHKILTHQPQKEG